MKHRFLIYLITLSAGLFAGTHSLAATLTSQVDRNQISINETVNLSISYDEQIDSSALDLRDLSIDFEIISNRPQSNSSISIINGKTTRIAKTTWAVTLVPKRQGQLTIPAFSISGNSSKPITIKVTSSTSNAPNDSPLNATISADNDHIYPGQQLLIEIELSAKTSVRNLNGEQIVVDGADIEVLDQKTFQRVDNGVARQIVVLKYVLFTDKTGNMTIPAQTFTGIEGGSRSLFDSFGSRGRQVAARTQPLTVTVKPTPKKDNTVWFVAQNVTIDSEWSRDTNNIKVGEPITRTIKIKATGQRASAIPPLKKTNITSSDYKTYADKPQLENQTSLQGYTGIRIESEAIVPSISGVVTLPEQRLSWWNTKARKWQEVTLPSETLTILPNSSVTNNSAPVSATIGPQSLPERQEGTSPAINLYIWKIATVLLSLICIAQFFLLVRRQQVKTNKGKQVSSNENDANYWAELKAALKSKDPASIRKCLLNWARIVMPDHNIASIQQLVNATSIEALKIQLEQLDRHLYRGNSELNVEKLEKAIIELRQTVSEKSNTSQNKEPLAPLYPT